MGGELLELLLDPASALHRELEVLAKLAVTPLAMGVKDLEQPGDGLAYGLLVPCRQVRAEGEVLVDRSHECLLAERLGKVVGYKAEMTSEQPLLKLWYLPPRQVVVQSVEEGGIDHRFGQVGEQVGSADELLMGLARVADEDHRSLGGCLLLAPSERAGLHVVLQHVDDRRV